MRIVQVPVPAPVGGTFQVSRRIGSYPRVRIEGGSQAVVTQAGRVLLVETVRKAGLDRAISRAPAAVATPSGGARSGQEPAGRGPGGRTRRGLPARHGPAAGRAAWCSAGGLRPDGLPPHRHPRLGRTQGPGRDPLGPVPAADWTAAIEPGGEMHEGAWVAELDGDVAPILMAAIRRAAARGSSTTDCPMTRGPRLVMYGVPSPWPHGRGA